MINELVTEGEGKGDEDEVNHQKCRKVDKIYVHSDTTETRKRFLMLLMVAEKSEKHQQHRRVRENFKLNLPGTNKREMEFLFYYLFTVT